MDRRDAGAALFLGLVFAGLFGYFVIHAFRTGENRLAFRGMHIDLNRKNNPRMFMLAASLDALFDLFGLALALKGAWMLAERAFE